MYFGILSVEHTMSRVRSSGWVSFCYFYALPNIMSVTCLNYVMYTIVYNIFTIFFTIYFYNISTIFGKKHLKYAIFV
jgi:hypothetical protein